MLLEALVPSTKKILNAIIVLNIFALIIYGVIFSGLTEKNRNFSELSGILDNNTKKEFEFRFIDSNLEETKKEREKLKTFFVQGNEIGVAKFIENVESIGSISGVDLKINSILIKDQESNNIVENIDLSLSVEGTWSDISYFLNLIETTPYKIFFKKVYLDKEKSLTKDDSDQWLGIFDINILKLKKV